MQGQNAALATRIREIMSIKRITHQQLADSIGCSRSTATKYVSGNHQLAAGVLPQVAECLGVPIARLYDAPGTPLPERFRQRPPARAPLPLVRLFLAARFADGWPAGAGRNREQ